MNGQELMINDLIRIKEPDEYAGAVARIKSLYWHKKDEGMYFMVLTETLGVELKSVFNEDIEGIILTKEIIELNKFKARHVNNACGSIRYSYFDKNGHKLISFYLDKKGNYVMQVGGRDVVLKYVHQLQHLLRSAEIEELDWLADNFKFERNEH